MMNKNKEEPKLNKPSIAASTNVSLDGIDVTYEFDKSARDEEIDHVIRLTYNGTGINVKDRLIKVSVFKAEPLKWLKKDLRLAKYTNATPAQIEEIKKITNK